MKALDTPVLLELLRGGPGARPLLRKLAGEDLATTEINLWELAQLAFADRSTGRDSRLAALDRLRRGITVLPWNSEASAAAIRLAQRSGSLPGTVEMILGCLEAHGATEWITKGGVARNLPKGPVRAVSMESIIKESKKRS